jgi:basic membrane protein A
VSDRDVKVGLVLPVGVTDHYDRAAYVGMERAVDELPIKGRVLTSAPREGLVPSLSLLARQGYDLIFGMLYGTGVSAADAVGVVATRYPETKWVILDAAHSAIPHRPDNVQGVVFREEEVGYLAGQLAMRVLKLAAGPAVISSVGAERVPAIENFIAGYEAGAGAVDPDVTTLCGYTHDFFDPLKARSVALSQIAQGSRVVFQVAGSCGIGALDAAAEHGVWGIGVDVDQSHLGPHVLTSALKRLDVVVYDTIGRFLDGSLDTGGTSVYSLRDGGVDLGPISPDVPGTVLDEIESVRDDIAAGTIPLPPPVT